MNPKSPFVKIGSLKLAIDETSDVLGGGRGPDGPRRPMVVSHAPMRRVMEPGLEVKSGTLRYELDMIVAGPDTREKYTDLNEAGALLLGPLEKGLRHTETPSLLCQRLRFIGTGGFVSEIDVGSYSGPFKREAAKHTISELRRLLDRMAHLLADMAEREPCRDSFSESPLHDAEMAQVLDFVLNEEPLAEDVVDPYLKRALELDPDDI